mmetsp:Transcript_25659/g.37917  ORF Transcript_25659/g.37917 Transcript_25659/m.37917 type:complete len:1960 (-) Transcript_25659:96-5975(-)
MTDADSFDLQDDQETWYLLSSDDKVASLDGFAERFNRDHVKLTSFWQNLLEAAESLGFEIAKATQLQSSKAQKSLAIPASFETSSGKKHINSLSKILEIDDATVVQLTLGALHSINTDNHLQSLLGTPSLFHHVLEFHSKQRFARLGIVTELLRGAKNDTSGTILDELDKQVQLSNNHRGLFQKLLFAACGPTNCPSSEQLSLLLGKLGDEQFVHRVLRLLSEQRRLEREQAMEALLSLLYARLEPDCCEFCLILLALQQQDFFTGYNSDHQRLAKLSGLLCAEAVNLNSFGPSHKFNDSKGLDIVKNCVMNLSQGVMARRDKHLGKMDEDLAARIVIPSPESIALLAVGLLLKLHNIDQAIEYIEVANECGAFEYTQASFDTLLSGKRPVLGEYYDQAPYDIQFSDSVPKLQIESDFTVPKMDSNIVIYTSVGLELVNGLVVALETYLTNSENVSALCRLGATLFANQPLLCEDFWRNPNKIGNLVESAYDMPSLWEILGSLCWDHQSVDRVFSYIPSDYMIASLTKSSKVAKDFALVVAAIGKMAQFNPDAVRKAFNDDPCVVIGLLNVHPTDENIMGQIFMLLSSLVQECPPWAIPVMKFYGARSSRDILPRCFNSEQKQTIVAAARLLHSLSNVMSSVCFSTVCTEGDVQEYINVAVKASIAACNSLATTLSFSCELSVSYVNAYYILKSTSTLLDSIRQLDNLHNNSRVRKVAAEARAKMFEAFSTSTSFGEMLAYFAAAPASLSMCIFLRETLQEAQLIKLATQEFANDAKDSTSEKWNLLVQQQSSNASIHSNSLVLERLQNLKNLRFDMNGIHNRGWSDCEYNPLHAAASSIALIKIWFAEAEHFALAQLAETKDDFLASFSPFNLLMSRATPPPVIRDDPSLENQWQTLSLRTCDLIARYVTVTDASDYVLPFWGSLDLLSLLLSHARYCGGIEGKMNNSWGVLFLSMKDCLMNVSKLLSDKHRKIDVEGATMLRRGMAFVRLLNNLFEADTVIASTFLDQENSAIATALFDSVRALTSDYSDEIPYRARFAAEGLSVIRSSKRCQELLPDLIKIVRIPRPPSIISSELTMQSLKLMTDAILANDISSDLKDIMKEQSFYEQPLQDFRACVISMCKQMSQFKTVTSTLNACMNLSSSSLFAQSFPNGHRPMLGLTFDLNLYDSQAAASFLSSFENKDVNASQIASATEGLLTALVLMKKQFEAVSMWASFAHGWAEISKSHELIEKITIFIVNELYELAVLKCDVEDEFAPFDELEAVIESMSTLLLHLFSSSPSTSLLKDEDVSKIVKTMDIVFSGTKLSYSKVDLTSLSNFLGIATILLKGSQTLADLTKFVNITRLGLLARKEEPHIFRQSLTLLAVILDNVKLANNGRSSGNFARAMKEQQIVESLVNEVCSSSARALDKDCIDEEEVSIVLSLLILLLVLVDIGEKDPSFISLFVHVQHKISKMLIDNPLYACSRWAGVSDDSTYRGYVKSSSSQLEKSEVKESVETFLSGRSDVVHKVWRLSTRLVANLAKVESVYDNYTHFSGLLDNFTNKYDSPIRSCLSHCSMVGRGYVLTRNVLDEAYEILSLLLVKRNSDRYTEEITPIVLSFGTFLGHIGTARLLPKLVREMEAANQDEDSPLENSQEIHPALAKGVANANREAVIYTHHARNAYAIVTADDYKLFSDELPMDVKDLDEFKLRCYKAINNSFAKEIENAVAQCLTSALMFLSKNHPAARCFIPFSKKESRNLNPMSIVKAGSIIAFEINDSCKFARVFNCNTVRRTWNCKVITPEKCDGGTDVSVSVDSLAGVEDVLKREVLLQYSPAPDAAPSCINKIGENATLGHLILALRWCRRDENGIDQSTRRRLAETASTLLATELALHSEIGTITGTKDSVKNLLNDQLFDLFDKDSKAPWLSACMGEGLLLCIQRQLSGMLDSARTNRVKERDLMESRLAALNNSNPWRD